MIATKIIKLTKVDSTNYFAMNLAMNPETEEFTVVWADEQTSGRGQGNNFWESETGKNLTFSIILKPCFLKIEQQFFLSKAISLALANFLQPITGHVFVKWPNDIYWKDKKICGILIENIVEQNIIRNSIAGIGLNINQEKFLSNAPNPVSLKNIMKQDYDLEFCLKEILQQIDRFYQLLIDQKFDEINQQYLSCLYRFDEFAEFKTGKGIFRAKIIRVEDSGELVLELSSGEIQKFFFKEIEFMH